MKRMSMFFLWLAGVILFLLVTAHFTLRHSLNTPKFRSAATAYIERHTGRTAEYERIDYTLFPFSLVIRNAALKEADGSRNFAAMDEFSVYVDWRAKEITSLRLAQPTIRIVQFADGSFNFSDLLPAPAEPAPEEPEKPADPSDPKPPRPKPEPRDEPIAPADPLLAIRLVQIENARFEFVSVAEDGQEETFRLTDLDLNLTDWAPGRPLRIEGSTRVGDRSSFRFDLSGPPLSDHAGDLSAWPIHLTSRLDIRDFRDLRALLPEDALPFESLWATLDIRGALAGPLEATLRLGTPAATQTHPVEVESHLQATLSLPPPVARHLFTGAELPEELAFAPPPCEVPPGAMSLTDDAATALLLRHLRADVDMTFPVLAYGPTRLTDGGATLELRDGVLTLTRAQLNAYDGTLLAGGRVHLLSCPLTYQLDPLTLDHLSIADALDAHGLSDTLNLSGRMRLEARVTGHAVAEEGLRSLEADASLRIDDLESVGTGGSLMDQAWLQLDNAILLRLLPRLKPKVEQARESADNVTTSRYEEVSAQLVLREGVATLTHARLSMPDYRLFITGTLLPFDDRMDLVARLVASPEETARLTDGRDRSSVLPYEDGGLMIPLTIRGALTRPLVMPDLDILLQNALAGGSVPQEVAPHLERLSESDQQRIQEGLQILQGLGRRPR